MAPSKKDFMTVCRSTVNTLLVGLQRIGIVGIREALMEVDDAGLGEQKEVVDRLVELLLPANYVPDPDDERFRRALWREFLRYRNEDFSDFLSQIDVTVRGESGEERERFLEALDSVLRELELEPLVELGPPAEEGPNPQLIIDGEVIAKGFRDRQRLRQSVHKSISDW